MTRSSFLFLFLAAVFGLSLFFFSNVNGFTSRSAIVVSRGLTIKATIDGVVADTSPEVGSRIAAGSALTSIENTRIDRSMLFELRSELEANRRRLELISSQVDESDRLIQQYANTSDSYVDWFTEDLRYTHEQKKIQLSTAEQEHKISQSAAERGRKLAKSGHIIARDLERLERNAVIDKNEIELLNREIAQIENQLRQLTEKGFLFSSNGNADYWTRKTDELKLELMQQKHNVLDLELNIEKLERRLEWENSRIAKESSEIHHSPFEGVVNAVFSSKGDLVTAETPLLQILDCFNPIAIVSVRESALGRFSIGQRATIKPIDSDQVHTGTVQYISNGPLISQDTSLAIPADVSQDGSKIIIAFDHHPTTRVNEACDVSRRAIVSIDTNGIFQQMTKEFKSFVSAEKSTQASQQQSNL